MASRKQRTGARLNLKKAARRTEKVVTPLPNKRLKLSAPGVCGKLLFVIIPVRRRSLGAPR